ncbi:MAG TPA: hypothetical protein DHV31_01625 [Clostridiales bacterium]|nr:hypothetical protein [Clostridiales bacterium]
MICKPVEMAIERDEGSPLVYTDTFKSLIWIAVNKNGNIALFLPCFFFFDSIFALFLLMEM